LPSKIRAVRATWLPLAFQLVGEAKGTGDPIPGQQVPDVAALADWSRF